MSIGLLTIVFASYANRRTIASVFCKSKAYYHNDMPNHVYYAIWILSFFIIEELSSLTFWVALEHIHNWYVDQFTYNCICIPVNIRSLTYSVSQSIFSQWDAELRLLRHFNTLVFHYRRVIITNVFSNSSIYNDMSIGVYLVYLHSA